MNIARQLIVIFMVILPVLSSSLVQAALTVDQIKAKIADEKTACQKAKESIFGIQQLDKKLPGIFVSDGTEALSRLTEGTSSLPEQERLPTAEEVKTAIASIKIGITCDDRFKELARPLLTPTMITYVESMNYLKVGQNLKLLTDGIPFRTINKSRVELYLSSKSGFTELMKQLTLGTVESVKEAEKIAKNAEAQLFSFLERYDVDVNDKKANGNNKCERIGPFEVCTK